MKTSPSSPLWARLSFAFLVALVILVIRTAPPARGENRIWTEPVQVSQSDSTVRGTLLLAPSPFTLHLAFVERNRCSTPPNCDHYRGGHLSVGSDLNWDWGDREYYTYVPTTGATGTIDASAFVDASGLFHVLYESWESSSQSDPDIGYKVQDTPRWPPDSLSYHVAPHNIGCSPSSPTLFLRDSSPDTLHLVYPRDWASPCAGLVHRMRSLASPGNDSTWSVETTVTHSQIGQRETGKGPLVVVDASGVVHFFGKHWENVEGVRKVWMLHIYGTPPASGTWTTVTADTLDEFTEPINDPLTDDEMDAKLLGSPTREPEVIDVAFNHQFSGDRREVYLCRITVGTSGFAGPVQVTPEDNISSPGLGLVHTGSDRVHVFYREGSDSNSRVFYTYSEDPIEGSWSTPEPVTPDVVTWARSPSVVADADTLWMLYSSGDDASGSDGGAEDLWFKKGVKMSAVQVPNGQTRNWSGYVYLDRDFLVDSTGTLNIAAGTVVVAADVDGADVGRDEERVELIVRGTLHVNGETDDRVRFESAGGEEGAWGGILFDLAAAQVGSYGYACNSYIHNADIKDGTSGIAIRRTGAPSLAGVGFTNITNDRHIACDSSDVYVPYLGAWNLTAPTTVKMAFATRSGAEIGGRNAGKVDLIVHGQLNTSSTGTDFVKFEPDTVPASGAGTSGDEWGGILFDFWGSGSVMDKADVGYALTPITLVGQDAEISNTSMHHFGDQGLLIYESGGDTGPRVHDCSVYREASGSSAELFDDFGHKGIVIDRCSLGEIEANTVEMTGVTQTEFPGGVGIEVQGTPTWCSAYSGDSNILSVSGNTAVGLGGNANLNNVGPWSGLNAAYACATSPRIVYVENNIFTDWNWTGMDFDNAKNLQVSCNRVATSRSAIEFARSDSSGPEVRFKGNALATYDDEVDSNQHVIQTGDAVKARFGPSGATLGLNDVVAVGLDWFVFENDGGSIDTLNAIDNYWEQQAEKYTTVQAIRDRCSKDVWVSDAIRIKAGSAETNPSSCAPTPQIVRLHGVHSQAEVVGDDSGRDVAAALELPTQTRLSLPGPSPSRGTVEVRFDLAGADRRLVSVEVFDVTGRRVKRLIEAELSGGSFGLAWRGHSESGEPVGSGVYFVRLRAGSITEVRKAVLLR